MIFTDKGYQGLEIKYESTDTDSEKRIIKQGVALLRYLLIYFQEIKEAK